MQRVSIPAALTAMTFAFGCGGAATQASEAGTMPVASSEPASSESAGEEVSMVEPATISQDALASLDLEGLPAAPWSGRALASDQVPAALLQAWANAANREVCAPIAVRELEGASARVSELVEGGWAVEFDRRGQPGMSPSGEACRSCGRGVFGIAGTEMTPDLLAGEDEGTELPTPSFADGSHLTIETPEDGERVAAATLTVRGQGCVYQVWSFLGEEHLRQLVQQLRRVEVRPPATTIAAR